VDFQIYKIGITGNIGSGKSTVCRIFETLKIPVYYSDNKAKELIHTNPEIISAYKQFFGNDIYNKGQLDRKRVSETLFKQKELLKNIEAVVHPAVVEDFQQWTCKQQSPFVLYESAIIFESGYYDLLDKIIFVSAPENLRVKRIMKRDGVSKENVYARIDNQWKEEKKIPLSDYVITCDDVNPLIPQVLELYNIIMKLQTK